ncbi:MAG: hypothetical protein L0Y71_17550, partial [Gemmataceae bacterium]|nr:hypothetical protein [Gemmataceae bacterium]
MSKNLRHFFKVFVSKETGDKVTVTGGGTTQSPAPGSQPASQPALQSITIAPASATLAAGGQQQFTAQAVYADGSKKDVTTTIDWLVNDLAVLSMDDKGLATAATVAGTAKEVAAEVTAMDAETGVSSPPAKVTVTAGDPKQRPKQAPALQGIAIEPGKTFLVFDQKQQLTATGWYSDDSSR